MSSDGIDQAQQGATQQPTAPTAPATGVAEQQAPAAQPTAPQPVTQAPAQQGQPPAQEPQAPPEAAYDYPKAEMPQLQSVYTSLAAAKVSVDDAYSIFKDALETGDVSKVNRAELVKRVGEVQADLLISAAGNAYAELHANAVRGRDIGHSVFGGEDAYLAAVATVKASPEGAALLQQLLPLAQSGNDTLMRTAMNTLKDFHASMPGTRSNGGAAPATATTPGAQPRPTANATREQGIKFAQLTLSGDYAQRSAFIRNIK